MRFRAKRCVAGRERASLYSEGLSESSIVASTVMHPRQFRGISDRRPARLCGVLVRGR